ncbi:MAG: NAD-dependent epimerase/dehydratase family protein [Blastocatellales bacterium]
MRELVLGGDGLIGSELSKQLKMKGHEVVSLDLKSGTDLRYVDNRPYMECDRVWFLAWDTGGAKYHSASDKQHQMFKHNSELSARVFDALAETKKPFLFVTSQLAGQPTAYGLTKLMAEKWADQLGGRIARLWNTFGWEDPDARSHVITDLVISGLTQGVVRTMTTGEERRRFIYKSDCARNLIEFFDGDLRKIDIAGDRWIKIRELASEVASQLNVDMATGALPGEEVMIDPDVTASNHNNRIPIPEGVRLVIEDARRYLESRALTSNP